MGAIIGRSQSPILENPSLDDNSFLLSTSHFFKHSYISVAGIDTDGEINRQSYLETTL